MPTKLLRRWRRTFRKASHRSALNASTIVYGAMRDTLRFVLYCSAVRGAIPSTRHPSNVLAHWTKTAFSRNIGWVTEVEQAVLRESVSRSRGSAESAAFICSTLARLGVGAFNLAEFDTFDLAHFNRQVGATVSTVGRPKLDVLIEMARDINPELDIQPRGRRRHSRDRRCVSEGRRLFTSTVSTSSRSRHGARPSRLARGCGCQRPPQRRSE